MITEIRFRKRNSIPVRTLSGCVKEPAEKAYAWNLPFFKSKSTVRLSHGVTALVGPNGSGKSTFLRMLAQETTCETGGWYRPLDPISLIRNGGGRKTSAGLLQYSERISIQNGSMGQPFIGRASLRWDGQPVAYIRGGDAHRAPLTIDSMDDVAQMISLSDSSAGERAGGQINRIAALLSKVPVLAARPTEDSLGVNQVWAEAHQAWWDWISDLQKAAKTVKRIPTLLLDEPDGCLDLPRQSTFWQEIQRMHGDLSGRVQILIATHSPFALLHDLNFLEFSPGYREDGLMALQAGLARELSG